MVPKFTLSDTQNKWISKNPKSAKCHSQEGKKGSSLRWCLVNVDGCWWNSPAPGRTGESLNGLSYVWQSDLCTSRRSEIPIFSAHGAESFFDKESGRQFIFFWPHFSTDFIVSMMHWSTKDRSKELELKLKLILSKAVGTRGQRTSCRSQKNMSQ